MKSDFSENPIVKKKVKGEKIKRTQQVSKPKKGGPIKQNRPDCDGPKESAGQLKKNIKNKNVNGGKGNGCDSE
jgi:hypothetical protein